MAVYSQYSDDENRALDLWVKLARAFGAFSRRSQEHIRSCGLTPSQFAVLECLGHKGEMTLGELSTKMLMSCGNMTVVVDNLEKEGLVERNRSASDRRVIHVSLTPSGKALFDQHFPDHAQLIARLAKVLSPHEQVELALLLKKLGHALKDA